MKIRVRDLLIGICICVVSDVIYRMVWNQWVANESTPVYILFSIQIKVRLNLEIVVESENRYQRLLRQLFWLSIIVNCLTWSKWPIGSQWMWNILSEVAWIDTPTVSSLFAIYHGLHGPSICNQLKSYWFDSLTVT